ncbi:MAG: SemiSWEET family transporter [Lactococcus raffinolactis]
MLSEKNIILLGRIATVLSVLMYVSYLAQIQSNLSGIKGNFIQPLVATVNCTCWAIYAFSKKERDYPVFIANLPGIFLGMLTVLTSF